MFLLSEVLILTGIMLRMYVYITPRNKVSIGNMILAWLIGLWEQVKNKPGPVHKEMGFSRAVVVVYWSASLPSIPKI